MTGAVDIADFRARLDMIVRRVCCGIAAGPNTGLNVDLHFGEKVQVPMPLRSSSKGPKYDGEVNLFVGCAWRLDGETEVICGSTDGNEVEGPMVRGLRRLEGLLATGYSLRGPALDMDLAFSGGYTMRIFCDAVNEEAGDNYGVYLNGTGLVVGPRGKLWLA